MSAALGLVVTTPVIAAALTVRPRGSLRAVIGAIAAGATVAAAIWLAVGVWVDGATSMSLEGPGSLQLVMVADGLGTVMVVMVALTGALVTAFAVAEDLRDPQVRYRWHWPLWFVLWAALQLLFLAGDLLTIYLMFEAVGVAGAALVALGGDRRSMLAGTRYLYAELAATTTVLLGMALLWREAATLELSQLGSALADSSLAWLGLGLVTAGLLVKVPLVPVHFWLPGAHALAPSAVSPMLSAVVVKSAFVVLIRLWFLAVPEIATQGAATLLGGLGAAAILWGSLLALRAVELKVLVAYSTVAQLGFMLLLIPLLFAGASDAWRGGVLYAFAHAPAKAAMLMAAAVLVSDAGRPEVAGLVGAAGRRPLAMFAIGISGVSLIGLPPTGGFVAKWYLLLAALESGQWWWIIIIVGGSLLTAAYVMRIVKPAFEQTDDGAITTRDWREAAALSLAGITVLVGLRPAELLQLIDGAARGGG